MEINLFPLYQLTTWWKEIQIKQNWKRILIFKSSGYLRMFHKYLTVIPLINKNTKQAGMGTHTHKERQGITHELM